MRHPAPTPANSALPLPAARAVHRRHLAGPIDLSPEAIEGFNQLLHELHADAPHVDVDAFASIARWLYEQPEPERSLLLQARLGRLAELETMRRDPDWNLDPAQSLRIDRLLAYVANESDFIPDSIPTLGRLDDALLVELVWPMLAEDLDDYRDFCRFRTDADAHPQARANQQLWLSARLEEGALWEQLHRVHEQHYIDYGAPDSGLHVR
ncbi:MAG TPA: YkvA family protein [Arenimonas sp.]|uniref:YkvA family protein n=1 Tax=Arenimonas sp. TaxID=1872635 RepID=UPI002C3288B8|nr:YkvA family protein [Arenimonas sp.]HMB57178.1 YkvA family protein [Arenimonas sp.]